MSLSQNFTFQFSKGIIDHIDMDLLICYHGILSKALDLLQYPVIDG